MENEKRSSEWIIGLKVRIKTSLGEEVEGEIWSYDTVTNCVVLTSTHSTLKKSFRILKTSYVKEIQYLGKSEQETDLPVGPVNIAKIRAKEEQTLHNLREEASRIGIGVTKEAQEIFNSLAKTWDRDNIIVFDEITIKKPYTAETCSGGEPEALERVKKVLEGERKRLQRNAASS